MPALFKLTYVTIKIMSESALDCLDRLVLALPVTSFLHQLDVASQDIHPQARAKSAGCLALALDKVTSGEELESWVGVIEEVGNSPPCPLSNAES